MPERKSRRKSHLSLVRSRQKPQGAAQLLGSEIHLDGSQRGAGSLRVHLVYPNTYHVGMSSLGYQTVLGLFSRQPQVTVERCFMPSDRQGRAEAGKPVTLESGRLLSDCDLLCASLSFEGDYLNFLGMLRACGLLFENPETRAEAAQQGRYDHPLILAGGTAVTLNPEPLADFLDLVALGEAEELVPEIVRLLCAVRSAEPGRRELLEKLSLIDGVYVPALHKVRYRDEGPVAAFESEVRRARRRFVADISKHPACSLILTPHTEFSSMFLAETGRGCEMGCRFCAAGYIYRPVRRQKTEVLSGRLSRGMQHTRTVGLMGAAVSAHRSVTDLVRQVSKEGGRASLSSLMSQKVTADLSDELAAGGQKTVALAPEAATERLRFAVGKRVSDAQILTAASRLSRSGIRRLKLYFMVGLPTEERQDIEAIPDLVAAVLGAASLDGDGKTVSVEVSLAPFVPKAWTPFQWEPVMDRKELEWRVDYVRNSLRTIANASIDSESVRETVLQALLSRGDRRVGRLLYAACQQGRDWKWLVAHSDRELVASVPAVDFYVFRRIPFDEVLPWEIMDAGIDRALLRREAERARSGG